MSKLKFGPTTDTRNTYSDEPRIWGKSHIRTLHLCSRGGAPTTRVRHVSAHYIVTVVKWKVASWWISA